MTRKGKTELKEELDEESEGLLTLAMLGGPFLTHAAGKLLSAHSCWGECRYWMLVSSLRRQDIPCARMYLQDWKAQDRKPKAKVSRFIPGEHYHTLNEKFDTLEEAIEFLHWRGYGYGGLIETHVYPKEGD